MIIALALSATIQDSRAIPASPASQGPTTSAWVKTYGWVGNSEAHSADKTSDGGYIVAGSTNETTWAIQGSPPSIGSDSDGWILKLDSSGSVQWQRSYRTTGIDALFKVKQISDGGYIAVGLTRLPNWGDVNAWVLRVDSQGNVLWDNSYGGSQTEQANDVVQTSDGGFLVVGFTYSFGGFPAWALRLNQAGGIVWQKGYNTTIGEADVSSVVATSDGGFVIAGSYRFDHNSGTSFVEAWLAKIDENGNLVWQRSYAGEGKGDQAYSVSQTSDGGLVLAGFTTSYGDSYAAIWVLRLDAQGGIIWQKAYGGGGLNFFDQAYSVAQLSDGSFIVGGSSSKAVVLKLDSQGNVVWSRGYAAAQFWQTLPSPDGGVLLEGGGLVEFGSGNGGMALVVKLDPDNLIGPGCDLEGPFNATTVDSTAVPAATLLSSFNTLALFYPVNAIVKDTATTISTLCSQFEMTATLSADALTLHALDKVAIHVHASSDNTPLTGANVTLDRNVPGNFSKTTGLTDSTGNLTVFYGAPNVSTATTITINVTISKQGYWTSQKLIQLTMNPLQRVSPNTASSIPWRYLIVGSIVLGSVLGLTAIFLARGRRAKTTETPPSSPSFIDADPLLS